MPCAETAKLGRSLSVPTARPERSGAGDEAGRDDRAPELFGGAVAELFIRLTAGVVGDVAVEWRYAAMLQRNAWLLRSRACLSRHAFPSMSPARRHLTCCPVCRQASIAVPGRQAG